MVVGFYQMTEMIGTAPSCQWHKCLEEAEEECHRKESSPLYAAQYNSACYGNRKAVDS